MRCAWVALLACLVLAGCGGGGAPPPPKVSDAPAVTTRPDLSTPAPPTGAPASTVRYARALDAYCAATISAVGRLARTKDVPADPVAPVAAFARSYRAGLERLARVRPPASVRRFHLLTLATSRESADRIDDGVRLGRHGDTDAATTALGEVSGLLPTQIPAAVRRRAPRCAHAFD